MRLTDESIRRAKRPTSGQLLLWDDLLSGFGIRLTPTAAAFVVQWRESSGKKPRESLRPRWPHLSVLKARDLARKRLSQVVALREQGGTQELRHAIRSWYERKSETESWRPTYRAKVSALIRHFVEGEPSPLVKLTATTRAAVEALGHKPVGSVTRSDVLHVVDGIKRGAADQFMATLSAFYNDAFDRGVEIPNPARNRLRVTGGRRVRTRTLTPGEFVAIWRAFEKEGDPALGAFALLALTGARRREATQARWSEVNLEAATWTLPPERRKTGRRDPVPFEIHLHPYLVEALRRQPVLVGNPHVFWGRRDKRAFEFSYALRKRLEALQLPDWRLHDVRRFVRSGMGRLGITQTVAEMCLGHVVGSGLVKVYDQHSYASEKVAAWQRWGDYLTGLIKQPQP
jgi:integrase